MSIVNRQSTFDTPYDSWSPLIVFAGGGTGGHLYPALAIADELRRRLPRVRFAFFGTQRAIDQRILGSAECDLIQQRMPESDRAPWRWPGIYLRLRNSRLQCRARFERDPPALVMGTGGLGSVPAVREAVRARIPTALLNPDVLPGRANRYLAGSADVIFAQWEQTVEHLPQSTHVVVCGCPVRAAFNRANREAGCKRFRLDVDRKTLLVTGASQGARTVNEAVLANLAFLESRPDWQVLHVSGEKEYEGVCQAYSGRSVRAQVCPFTDHMAEALAAADLVVARAGASTLAELTAVGRASILMPYPYHRDMHQLANARGLVRASAARIVHDKIDAGVNGAALRHVLEQLMTDDEARNAMAAAARRLGRGQAASQIADHLVGLAEARGTLPCLTV